MAIYQQLGHHSINLLQEAHLSAYTGAILNPVSYTEDKTQSTINQFKSSDFELVFDPQLYYPNSERGGLSQWQYFPSDVDTADQSSLAWWRGVIINIAETIQRLLPSSVCSPAIVPRVYSDDYYSLSLQVANELAQQLNGTGVGVLQTLIVKITDLGQPNRAAEIASIVSSPRTDRVYLVFVSDSSPKRELAEVEEIKGAMRLIRFLENAGIKTIIAFTCSDILLWKFAGASVCATGKHWSIRRFAPSRFQEYRGDRDGQVSYLFEESLMAFLRQSDVVRVCQANLISQATISNPYYEGIISKVNTTGMSWLRESWCQYLYWFADIEKRIVGQEIDPQAMLVNAEQAWSTLDAQAILMEERQNNGNWLRAWRRALVEAFQ